MKITFDPKKNADNIRERQLSFDEVSKLEWSSAVILEDVRKDYGERRFRVLGTLMNVFMRSCLRHAKVLYMSLVLERLTVER